MIGPFLTLVFHLLRNFHEIETKKKKKKKAKKSKKEMFTSIFGLESASDAAVSVKDRLNWLNDQNLILKAGSCRSPA